ncbi:unnamed protein product [Ixodes pacificus]
MTSSFFTAGKTACDGYNDLPLSQISVNFSSCPCQKSPPKKGCGTLKVFCRQGTCEPHNLPYSALAGHALFCSMYLLCSAGMLRSTHSAESRFPASTCLSTSATLASGVRPSMH